MNARQYYVYILTNSTNSVLYIGVTNNIIRRVYEHKTEITESFSSRYKLHKLVYFEACNDAESAISREKQLKGGSRKKKIDLIIGLNPEFKDLYSDLL